MENGNQQLLTRVDERSKVMQEDITFIKKELSHNYVSKAEFQPVRVIVFGLVSIILISVLGAFLFQVGLKP